MSPAMNQREFVTAALGVSAMGGAFGQDFVRRESRPWGAAIREASIKLE